MTSAIATEVIVEYHFRCFCGAPIIATEKRATCANCGETLGIRRVKRQHRKIAPAEVPHRSLQPADLQTLAIRLFLYLLLGYYLFDSIDDFVK